MRLIPQLSTYCTVFCILYFRDRDTEYGYSFSRPPGEYEFFLTRLYLWRGTGKKKILYIEFALFTRLCIYAM